MFSASHPPKRLAEPTSELRCSAALVKRLVKHHVGTKVHTSTATVAIMPEVQLKIMLLRIGPTNLFHQVEESENIDEFGAKHWDLMGSRELAWIPDQRQKIMKEIKFQFCRAGGKGGQNVNKALQNCSTLQRIHGTIYTFMC